MRTPVIYSPPHGSGFTTWVEDRQLAKELVHDVELAKLVEAKAPTDSIKKRIDEIRGDRYVYIGSNIQTLTVEWLKPGTQFRVDEYDGAESVVTTPMDVVPEPSQTYEVFISIVVPVSASDEDNAGVAFHKMVKSGEFAEGVGSGRYEPYIMEIKEPA